MMKKVFGFLASMFIILQMIPLGVFDGDALAAYYEDFPKITGEESRTVSRIYDGVTRTDFVLANDTKYKRQAFSTVEFDPKQDDLYLEVMGGGPYSFSKRTTTNTVKAYNNENPDKTALAGINGDMWIMNNYHVRKLGSEGSYKSGYKYPANVTSSTLTIPRGFTMYGGEIICTTHMVQEVPYEGTFQSFGISSDGTPLLGNIIADISINNASRMVTVKADGINRLPENNALVVYTDKSSAGNYCLSDAYEVVIDCDYDYTLKHGAAIGGRVTAVTKSGTASSNRENMKQNRIILTARGDRVGRLSSFQVGDLVILSVSISDEWGNTQKWRTVTDCVGGHMPIVIDGVSQNLMDSTNYPTSIIGIKNNRNVVLLTSWGRQGNSYSYGLYIYQLDELFAEMGIKTAFLMDGGGSATMVCETRPGSYELTGKPCDSGNTERAVVNSVILAKGPSKSGHNDTDLTFDSGAETLFREPKNVAYTIGNGILTVTAADFKNPEFKLDLFGSSADEYKYMVIEASPTFKGGGTFTLGVYPAAGSTYDPVIASSKKVTFDCNGTWQRRMVDLSGIAEWQGRMNYIRLDLFDDTGVGTVGEGLRISRVRLFKTRGEAETYLKRREPGDLIIGDADGSGREDLADVVMILQYIVGWDVDINTIAADYDKDGSVGLNDALELLRSFVI